MTYQESIPKRKKKKKNIYIYIYIYIYLTPKEFTYTNSCNEHSLKFKWAQYEKVQKPMSF
jgi:hypothetical protein